MPTETGYPTGPIPDVEDTRLAGSSYALLYTAMRELVQDIEETNAWPGHSFMNTGPARIALFHAANPHPGQGPALKTLEMPAKAAKTDRAR